MVLEIWAEKGRFGTTGYIGCVEQTAPEERSLLAQCLQSTSWSLLQLKSASTRVILVSILRKKKLAEGQAMYEAIDAANSNPNPISVLSEAFHSFCKNGLNIKLETKKMCDMEPMLCDWIVDLTERNMQSIYERSQLGWNLKVKRREMMEDAAFYLIAWKVTEGQDGLDERIPVGFSHFRFDSDDGAEVLYCYELQLEEEVRRKGLGRFMMQVLELMSFKCKMKRVVLTVFHHNEESAQFFRKLGYTEDETSPEDDPLTEDYYDYWILSKPTVPKKST